MAERRPDRTPGGEATSRGPGRGERRVSAIGSALFIWPTWQGRRREQERGHGAPAQGGQRGPPAVFKGLRQLEIRSESYLSFADDPF